MAVAAALLVAIGGCSGGSGVSSSRERDPGAARPIEEVLAEYRDGWMEIPGVVGTGIGLCEGHRCIRVFVSERTAEVEREIPAEVEGYTVDVVLTGRFEAQDGGRP